MFITRWLCFCLFVDKVLCHILIAHLHYVSFQCLSGAVRYRGGFYLSRSVSSKWQRKNDSQAHRGRSNARSIIGLGQLPHDRWFSDTQRVFSWDTTYWKSFGSRSFAMFSSLRQSHKSQVYHLTS